MDHRAFKIRSFREGDQRHFAALNLRWITELVGAEPEDLRQLEEPRRTILDPGGYIAIGEREGEVVATGALIPALHPPDDALNWGEIVKMAAAPEVQGLGLGGAILDHLVTVARDKGFDGLWLETNSRLTNARALYGKRAFEPLASSEQWDPPYSRCNLQMVLRL
jgi:GNAT superfamily N-acetyltransferase